MYSLDKYRFFIRKTPRGIETIAVSSYAGKTVRGKSICHPKDEYDELRGKEIAAARCNLKIAEKRSRRALSKFKKSRELQDIVDRYCDQMQDYHVHAEASLIEAENYLFELLDDQEEFSDF